MTLCEHCQKALQFTSTQARWRHWTFYRRIKTFINSVAQGCLICRNIHQTLIPISETKKMLAAPPPDDNLGLSTSWPLETSSPTREPLPEFPFYFKLQRLIKAQPYRNRGLRLTVLTLRWLRKVAGKCGWVGPLQISIAILTPETSTERQDFLLQVRARYGNEHVDPMYFALWPSSDREDRFQEVIQSTNTCSLGGQELWRHWVRDCSENHDHCKRLQRSSGFLPARLLEITGGALNGAPPTWRLLEEDDRPASVSYLTLSHCWGSKVPTRLTRATLDRFLSDDPKKPVSELPQTFQDAMNITLSMGLRHLWIDCLCIIQGDEDDWKEQSSVMSLIYRHATCNIAATWAKGGSEGCFSDRSPATATRTRITLQTSPERSTTGGFNMMPLGFYWEQVNSAPLNKRGWVVQERYMAPRQLNFAKGEVYWECSQLIASEQFPSGLPGSIVLPEVAHDYIRRSTQAQQVMQLKPHVGHGTELELRVAWTNILSRYTSSDLTFYKDKLMAIAGIASELRDSLNDEYLAGMWRKDLHKQLCWRAASAWDRECVWAHSRACLYLAPTWSWASCQGPLILDTSYHEGGPTGRAHFLEVIDARVEAEHPSGLHSFVSGTLKIRSIAMWARLEERVDLHDASIEVPSPSRRSGSGLDYLFGTMIYTLVWDEVFQEEPDAQKKLQESRKSDLLLAFVSGPSLRFPENYLHDIHGLILVPAGNGEFTRGGMFKHSRTLDSEYDISGLVCARLGLDHQVGLEGGFDLGDPRLSDLVHTVTIR